MRQAGRKAGKSARRATDKKSIIAGEGRKEIP
jgi:hypothetical protein